MIKKDWKINNETNTKPLIERLLDLRGISSDSVKDFLNPLDMTLMKSDVFCDMSKAVERVKRAVDSKETILIYGDFDADGVTSTSLLFKTLKHIGADVHYYIPSREADGHGLNLKVLVKLMVSVKPSLIITVDCGISNIEEVKFINSFKRDVIITDHHEAAESLPDAYAIINPKAQNSLDENLSTKEILYMSSLAGVGVAFKFAQAVLDKFAKSDYAVNLLPYVAVGTIADIVPLIGENRYFVLKGLDLISKGYHYGIKRILESAGYNNVEDGITADKIAFGVAPRINASGRLGTVEDAMRVLISENNQEIELSIIALNNYNKIRQELESKIVQEADSMAKDVRDNVIVLYKKDWHVGIIGIAASCLVEKYGKPTFLMTYSEDTNQIRCSARGVEGCEDLNLYDIISNISDKLDGFGGHALAAGLYFTPDKVSFEEIKKLLIKSYNDLMQNKKAVPVLNIDALVQPDEITENLVNDIARLEPFGASNPPPVFAVKDFILTEKRLMGSNNDHLRLTVEKDGFQFNAIWWSRGDISLKKDDKLDIAFSPQLNTFNGKTSIQLIIKDVHSDSFVEPSESNIIVYDNRNKTDIADKVNDYLKSSKYSFCVFAENNVIVQSLKKYPEIYSRIVTRQTLKKSDGIMFFDYPPTVDILNDVVNTVNPKRIHFMAYDSDNVENINYIKQIAGMIKYACNTIEGRFNLEKGACFLGVTPSIIEILLDIFEECGCIKIKERSGDEVILEYIKKMGEDDYKNADSYETLKLCLSEISDTRKTFLTEDVSSVVSIY